LCLFLLLFRAATNIAAWQPPARAQVEALPLEPTATPLGMGLLGARVDNPDRSGYLLVFEIISVHLLVVLIGAAYLARAKRKRSALVE
jgi:NADH-quinone oxidoreductase subunit J